MNPVVVRPQVPFWGPISGGISIGKLIEIQGSVPYGADVFEINLVTGSDPASDRPLHISVRFHGRIVVRNTMERNQWGDEERGGPFPFASGREFRVLIRVDQDAYRIAVDSQHAWEFAHRIPLQRANMIFIGGSVKIDRIEFINSSSPYQIGTIMPPPVGIPGAYPVTGAIMPGIGGCIIPGRIVDPGMPVLPGQNIGTCMPSLPGQRIETGGGYFPSTGIQPTSNLSPVYNPTIPYAYPIYGGLKAGMMIYISGRPSANAYRFTLNFQCGTSPYPPPDIAFHFDARFFNSTVVRNSRTNNEWANEDVQAPFFPFQHGVNFDMMIRVESDRYMIALNGQHFAEFNHRMWPLSRIDTLYIEHDIVVSSIRFA